MTAVEHVGKALAALVAAGIGCAVLGVLTTLAELSPGLKSVLNVYDPVGPLSGKTTVAVIVWLITWYALARRWHARPPVMTSALVATFVLIGVGFVGTFPLFFELFTAH
jgi:hypothetical protein